MRVKFRSWECELKFGYYENGRIAIQLIDAFDKSRVAVATVNVPEIELEEGEIIIKNYTENEGMLEALCDAGIIEPVREEPTGLTSVNICKLKV